MLPSSCFFAASQLRSLSFTLPFFCGDAAIQPLTPASSTAPRANTSSTPGGGLTIVLHSPRSFSSSVSSAAIAASTAGSALARSSGVVAAFSAPRSGATDDRPSPPRRRLRGLHPRRSFSACTRTSAMPSATSSSVGVLEHDLEVLLELTDRLRRLLAASAGRSRGGRSPTSVLLALCSSEQLVYSLSSSRYDLGVVYTKRRSNA